MLLDGGITMRTDKKYSPDFENKKMQLELEKQRYAASRATPKFGDRSGEGFQRMADRTQDKDIYGRAMFQGLADGFRVSADRERSKEDEAFMKKLEPLQKWNDAMQETLEQGRKQQEQDKTLADDINASIARLEVENNKPFQEMGMESQNNLLQSIFSRHNERTGLGDKYIGLTWQEGKPKVIYENTNGETKIKDPEEIGYNHNPDYVKQQLDEKKAKTQQQNIDQQGFKNSPEGQFLLNLGRKHGDTLAEELPKLKNKLTALSKADSVLSEIDSIAQKIHELDPGLAKKLAGSKLLEDNNGQFTITKAAAQTIAGTELTSLVQQYANLMNVYVYDKQAALGGRAIASMLPYELGQLVDPINASYKTIQSTIGRLRNSIQKDRTNFESQLKDSQQSFDFIQDKLKKNPEYGDYFQSNTGQQPQDNNQSNFVEMIKVKEGGSKVKIKVPIDMVEQARQAGALDIGGANG